MEKFLQLPSDHSHTPNPNRLLLIRIQNEIKERGASSGEPTSTILHNVLRTVPVNIAAELPSTQSLSQTIRRQRMAPSLEVNGHLPSVLKQTDRGENFVLFEDDSMIIFTSDSNLSVLKECKHWFADGTFSVRIPSLSLSCNRFDRLGVPCEILPIVYTTRLIRIAGDTTCVCIARRQKNRRLRRLL
jgi:hypothetical protein